MAASPWAVTIFGFGEIGRSGRFVEGLVRLFNESPTHECALPWKLLHDTPGIELDPVGVLQPPPEKRAEAARTDQSELF
jgi:hypothetical protein